MRIHFVTFATPAFRVRQCLLNRSAIWFGKVDQLHVWNEYRLSKDGFTTRHPELFPKSTGFGWYAWKPYLILKALDEAREGDLVFYQDIGRRDPVTISRPLGEWNDFLKKQDFPCIAGVSIPHWGANRLWTKRSTFKGLGLQGPLYEDSPQVQASWSVWRKLPQTLSFVREWAEHCQCLDLVGGQLENGREGEVPGFREHRWDQSILTLLALRDGMPVLNPTQARLPGLNEKSIDSFSPHPSPGASFEAFMSLIRLYHFSERTLKRWNPFSR